MKCDYPGCEKELSKEEVAAYNRIDKKNVEYGCFKHNEHNIFMTNE